MPFPDPEGGLQSVIVRCTYAVELQDGAEVGKGIILVDVGYDVQLAALAANISHLEHSRFPKSLFDLEIIVVEVRYTEVLAYGTAVQVEPASK